VTKMFDVQVRGLFAGSLRESPDQVWWAELLPTISVGVLVLSVVVTALFLPKVLRGGLSASAVMRVLMPEKGSEASTPAKDAPQLSSLEETESDTTPGNAPTWAEMDLSIFDEEIEAPPVGG
jgi:hypothetical protein